MSLLYPPKPWCEWCDVWRLTTTPGSTSPTLFEQCCGFFYVPQEPDKCKCCETGPTVFRPYPRTMESLTVCRCHYKGNTFFSFYLKTLSVGPAGVRARDLPLSRPALSQLSQPGGGVHTIQDSFLCQHEKISTVSVKMVGTLWGLPVLSMLVYKIWWPNRDKQLWEGQGKHENEKNSVWLKCPNYSCLRL